MKFEHKLALVGTVALAAYLVLAPFVQIPHTFRAAYYPDLNCNFPSNTTCPVPVYATKTSYGIGSITYWAFGFGGFLNGTYSFVGP